MHRRLVEEYNHQPTGEYELTAEGAKGVVVKRFHKGIGASKSPQAHLLNSPYQVGFLWALYLKPVLVEVFLPRGYPHTVTPDYIDYQLWDTLQAFASSLTGSLATSALLKGIGVGNDSAQVLAASITWLLKDGTGMLGRIVFAWAEGSKLDADCKRWRLMADLLNDIAFAIDLLALHLNFTSALFFPMTCLASLLRSLVGVAGGATRMAIIRHQARRDNLADVAAKDGSQETVVNVLSLVISLILLPQVDERPVHIWLLFFCFTAIHLFANYKAVKSLQFDILNQQRLILAVRHFILHDGDIIATADCNAEEAVLLPTSFAHGRRYFGCCLDSIPPATSEVELSVGCSDGTTPYIIAYSRRSRTGWLALSASATDKECLNGAFSLEYYAAQGKMEIIHSSAGG